METLGQKQERFSLALSHLIREAFVMGYQIRMGEVRRSDEQAEINALGAAGRGSLVAHLRRYPTTIFRLLADKIANNTGSGIRDSLHEMGLAVDLHLFRDGVYLNRSEDHRPLGGWWKRQSPDHRWGGDWGDGNHYSIEHEGKK